MTEFAAGILAIALGILSLNLFAGRKRPAKQEPIRFPEPTERHHEHEEEAIPAHR